MTTLARCRRAVATLACVAAACIAPGAAAQAVIRVTPASTGEARELHTADLDESSGWSNAALDLGEHAGDVIRLDFEVSETAGAASASPDAGAYRANGRRRHLYRVLSNGTPRLSWEGHVDWPRRSRGQLTSEPRLCPTVV